MSGLLKKISLKIFLLIILFLGIGVLASTNYNKNLNTHAAKPVQNPDLSVQFDPTPYVVPGNNVKLNVVVTNTKRHGDLTDGDVHISVFTGNQYDPVLLSTDHGFSCQRADSGRYSTPQYDCTGASIAAGESATITFTIQTPDMINSANEYYGASAYLTNYDVSSSDSVLIAPFYQPDLRPYTVSDKATVLLGDSVTYSVYVFNGGYQPSGPTTMNYQLPDGTTGVIDIPALNAGEFTPTHNINFTTQEAGQNVANFVVDPDNLIAEHSETNNTDSVSVTVEDALPDLTVNISAPSTVAPYTPFTETSVITNQGNGPANNFSYKVIFSGPYDFRDVGNFAADHGFVCTATYGKHWTLVRLSGYLCTGGSLAAGESATVSVDIVSPYYAGTYYTNGKVDSSSVVTESDETNNSYTAVITVN